MHMHSILLHNFLRTDVMPAQGRSHEGAFLQNEVVRA